MDIAPSRYESTGALGKGDFRREANLVSYHVKGGQAATTERSLHRRCCEVEPNLAKRNSDLATGTALHCRLIRRGSISAKLVLDH